MILEDFIINEDLISTIEQNVHEDKNFKIKVKNSSKGDYKAIHVYFHGENNKMLPWELQVWNKSDESKNKVSHVKHKQSYTRWTKDYKANLDEDEEGVD